MKKKFDAAQLYGTPEEREATRRYSEMAFEFGGYVMDNLADEELLERINGSTIVFDKEMFEYEKKRNDGRKVILAKKTYQYEYA